MLNIIWCAFFVLSVVYSAVTGNLSEITSAIFDASAKAVNLSISLTATICFWSGIMQITSDCGIAEVIASLLRPVTKIIFPELKENSRALSAIVMNITANLLGLGNAATPIGLDAMHELDRENNFSCDASDAMCRFVVMNTASLQLVPTTIIGLRTVYGSSDPASILIPVWITSAITLTAGLLCTKLLNGRKRHE